MRPIELLDACGCLSPRTTVVHATHAGGHELDLLAAAGARVCACPTTEADLADGFLSVERLLHRGIELCIGSDSNVRIVPARGTARDSTLDRPPQSGRRDRSAPSSSCLQIGTENDPACSGLGKLGGRIEPALPSVPHDQRAWTPRSCAHAPSGGTVAHRTSPLLVRRAHGMRRFLALPLALLLAPLSCCRSTAASRPVGIVNRWNGANRVFAVSPGPHGGRAQERLGRRSADGRRAPPWPGRCAEPIRRHRDAARLAQPARGQALPRFPGSRGCPRRAWRPLRLRQRQQDRRPDRHRSREEANRRSAPRRRRRAPHGVHADGARRSGSR